MIKKKRERRGGRRTLCQKYREPSPICTNLVQKTFYSTSKNPHTYFVIHAVGTLLKSTRSKHAKHLSDRNILNNVYNAKLMAYAFSNSVKLQKTFKIEGQNIEVEYTSEMIDDGDEPRVQDGLAW